MKEMPTITLNDDEVTKYEMLLYDLQNIAVLVEHLFFLETVLIGHSSVKLKAIQTITLRIKG